VRICQFAGRQRHFRNTGHYPPHSQRILRAEFLLELQICFGHPFTRSGDDKWEALHSFEISPNKECLCAPVRIRATHYHRSFSGEEEQGPMNRPDVRLLQVALTGTRLASCSEEELLVRLKTRFKLTEAQGAAMLKGRCIVKRGIDAASARKLAGVLGELGLQAVVEEMPPPPATLKESASKMLHQSTHRDAPTAVHRARVSPKPAANADPQQDAATQAVTAPLDALHALAGQRLLRPRTSFPYMVGLLLVTLVCVALPAMYIGLTCGVTFGWFWYLTHIHEHLPRDGRLIALMYAVPGLMGTVLVLFFIRPLFAASPRPREALKLDPEKEAAFVSGVHALCRAIGVSPPIEIRLSWDANASVQFRTRWLSLFTGHKVLTIGLSLVGGLNARQFVGVLAHEFGHFAQRIGMICAFTVNSVNAWLEHCAHGEDDCDRKLREWSDAAMEKEHWFSWIVNLSIAASWIAIGLTRRLMAGLFQISLRLSRYMSRQMEFDADRYEALLAGSHIFRTTARSLRALNHAFAEVNEANIRAWQEHRLLRDLPEAVAAHAREFDATRLARIEEEMSEQTTARYWDSHPPDVERIDNAEKRRAPGIYLEDGPAAVLFRDFSGWSQRATRLFYAERGVQFTAEQLRSRDEILGHVRNRNQQREHLNRFFNGQFQDWPLLQLYVKGAADAGRPGWQDCIDQIRDRSLEIARHWLQAFQAHERRPLLRTAVRLDASSRQLGLRGVDRSPQELGTELESIAARSMAFHRPLEEGFALYAMRIEHAIASMPALERGQAMRLRDTLARMGALEREVSALDELAGAMRVFGSIADSNGEMPAGFDRLESDFGDFASQLLARADRIPQTVTADGTVGAYLRARCRDLPPAGTSVAPAVLARAALPLPGAFQHLFLLALGELVTLCEAAEKGCGISPIRVVA
jgi:Zn-dependent protease with chaperone function